MANHPMWPKHEWDGDCCCIHCGIDGCDVPTPWREHMPPCTVHSEEARAVNRKDYQDRLIDEPGAYWDQPELSRPDELEDVPWID